MFRKHIPCQENSAMVSQNSHHFKIPYGNSIRGSSTDNCPDTRYSVGIREDLSHILKSIDSKRSNRSHFRNLSDITCPTSLKMGEINQTLQSRNEQRRIKYLQNKLNKVQERLGNIQYKIEKLDSVKNIEETILTNVMKQNDKKIHQFSSTIAEVKLKLEKINFNTLNSYKGEGFNSHQATICENQIQEKLQQKIYQVELSFEEIKKEILTKIRQMNEKIKSVGTSKEYQQAVNPENHFFRTNRKYSGNYVSFLYEEFIKRNEKIGENQNKQNETHNSLSQCINQITYYIDPEGFLLDQNSNYLVNSKMKQIKLSQKQLKMLRKLKIIQS